MVLVMTMMQSTPPGPGTTQAPPSDVELVAQVGEVLAMPRADQADSFVLHAPLELVARAALLPYVQAAHREQARRQITAIAEEFEDFGPPAPEPAATDFASTTDATTRLVATIERGELDDIDAAAALARPRRHGDRARGSPRRGCGAPAGGGRSRTDLPVSPAPRRAAR